MRLQGPAGHRRGDVGVAVPVAADPRGEAEEGGRLDPGLGIMPDQRLGQPLIARVRRLEQGLVEEVQPPGDLVLQARPVDAQLAGHPQDLDLVADLPDQMVALARGPARRLHLDQLQIDPPETLQHGHPLGLGRVGGQGRRDLELRQRTHHDRAVDVHRCRFRQRMAERADHVVRPAGNLGRPAAAHLAVLLGDALELKLHADRLQRLDQQLRVARKHAVRVGEQPRQPRLVGPDHLGQQAGQQFRDGAVEMGRRGTPRCATGFGGGGGLGIHPVTSLSISRIILLPRTRSGASPCAARHILWPPPPSWGRLGRGGRRRRSLFASPMPRLGGRGGGAQNLYAASPSRSSTCATVAPMLDGSGATVTPAFSRITTFSCALSPKAEMIAPAWPMRRPFGADRPAT